VVKGTSLWLVDRWGGAREFKVDTSTSIPHGRAEDYRADVIRVSGEDPSVQVDKRMVDGSWKKNVISNSAGWTVFPELSFVVTAERDEYWDCLPGDKGPSY
ncbi:hypothetical protein, partial [Salmonella sp. 2019-SM259]|uniref:hypothetical protein n=1 Tax=Salmonella sp. 2019-SM259 TaxID=3068194 RepID=UPI0037706F09